MEYVVALLLIAIIVLLFFKQPNKLYDSVINATIETLESKEAELVHGIYNKLPSNIKEKVDSKTIAEIVGFTIGIIIDVLRKK